MHTTAPAPAVVQRSLTCDDCPLRAKCPRYCEGHPACTVGRNPAMAMWSFIVGLICVMTLVLSAL